MYAEANIVPLDANSAHVEAMMDQNGYGQQVGLPSPRDNRTVSFGLGEPNRSAIAGGNPPMSLFLGGSLERPQGESRN